MTVDDPVKFLDITNVLLRSLGQRVLTLITLVMTFSLFVWAMLRAEVLTSIIAAAFGLGVLWPVLYIGWKNGDS